MTDRPTVWKTFPMILEAIQKGELPPPNLEEISPQEFINILTSVGWTISGSASIRVPGGASYAPWARYFTSSTQGGIFDGTGYVVWYVSGGNKAGKFAICKHKSVEDPGANHMRGWHPAHCSICGLDMSVDSGD